MEGKNELLKALLNARKEFKPCKMSGINPFFGNSKYSTLEDIKEACEDALLKNNILAYHTIDENKLTCHIVHTESGQELTSTIEIRINYDGEDEDLIDDDYEKRKKRKRNITQEMGAWITYLRRYTLAPLLGIVADEDIDGNTKYQQKNAGAMETTNRPATKNSDEERDKYVNMAFAICKNVLHMTDEMMKEDVQKYFKVTSRRQMTTENWKEYLKILNEVHMNWKITDEQKEEINKLLKTLVNLKGEQIFNGVSDPKFLKHLNDNVCKQYKDGAITQRPIASIDDVLWYEAEYIKRKIMKEDKDE